MVMSHVPSLSFDEMANYSPSSLALSRHSEMLMNNIKKERELVTPTIIYNVHCKWL